MEICKRADYWHPAQAHVNFPVNLIRIPGYRTGDFQAHGERFQPSLLACPGIENGRPDLVRPPALPDPPDFRIASIGQAESATCVLDPDGSAVQQALLDAVQTHGGTPSPS